MGSAYPVRAPGSPASVRRHHRPAAGYAAAVERTHLRREGPGWSSTCRPRNNPTSVSGDTLLHDRLHDIPRWFPDIDLALIHAGGTTLLGTVVTMTGEQAVRCVEIIGPRTAVPIHYNGFSVFRSGLDDLEQAAEAASVQTEFHYVAHGDEYRFRATR